MDFQSVVVQRLPYLSFNQSWWVQPRTDWLPNLLQYRESP